MSRSWSERRSSLREEVAAAKERNEKIRAALEFIRDGYDNQDVSHEEFRVRAYAVALDALSSQQSKEG